MDSRFENHIINYLHPVNIKLGQVVDISTISSEILSLKSVRKLKTSNTEEAINFEGLSFVAWNPMFEGVDETLINQTTTLPYFKYPYIFRPNTLINRIEVIDSTGRVYLNCNVKEYKMFIDDKDDR